MARIYLRVLVQGLPAHLELPSVTTELNRCWYSVEVTNAQTIPRKLVASLFKSSETKRALHIFNQRLMNHTALVLSSAIMKQRIVFLESDDNASTTSCDSPKYHLVLVNDIGSSRMVGSWLHR